MSDVHTGTLVSDADIEGAIFPTEEWIGTDNPKHPDQTVDATRVQVVQADSVATETFAVPSYVDNGNPLLIVPKRGNNERKSVLLSAMDNDIVLFADPTNIGTPVTVGGTTFFTNGFILRADSTYVYESVAPLWALSLAPTTEFSYVSVMTESYYRNK